MVRLACTAMGVAVLGGEKWLRVLSLPYRVWADYAQFLPIMLFQYAQSALIMLKIIPQICLSAQTKPIISGRSKI